MGVALVCWGRFLDKDNNKITVPAPSTDGADVPWLWDFLAAEAPELAARGFSALQLPPEGKAQGGAGVGCDGYGVFDPRDQGSKPQQGSTPTRYGTQGSLRRLVARAHASGLQVYLDLVLHQRIGANAGAGTYRYVGADGKTLNGRGPLDPGCFRGVAPANRPQDDVPNAYFDFSFGDELDYEKALPAGYTINDALDALTWRFQTTGADGGRIDDVKGMWAGAVHQWASSAVMGQPTATAPQKMLYGEFFDGVGPISAWVSNPPMSGRVAAEDFPLHFALQSFCGGGSAYSLNDAGLAAVIPAQAITFVENPDTDLSPGQNIIAAKMLAYAFILTCEGYPFVYGKDYFGPDVWPGAYGLKPMIDNLIWIHENLANGPTQTMHIEERAIVLARTGSPGLLTAISNDTWNRIAVTCPTPFGPNVQLHDYAGHHPDITTDATGAASFTIPSNAWNGGNSYLCFAPAGIDRPFAPASLPTTQVLYGSADLDLRPAVDGDAVLATLDIAAGSKPRLRLVPSRTGWTAASAVSVFLRDSAGTLHCAAATDLNIGEASTADTVPLGGHYDVVMLASGMPAGGSPFEVFVTYTGTRGALVPAAKEKAL